MGPSEIGAQCAIRKSARSSTVIREGPPISVRPSRQGAPHVPVQSFPLGRPLRETRAESSVPRRRIFSAGRQAGGDGERKRRMGEAARVTSEWARMKSVHKCAIRKSAPSSTVIREGPPISVRPPRQGSSPRSRSKFTRWGRPEPPSRVALTNK